MAPIRDFTGEKIGHWTVLDFVGIAKGRSQWLCRCVCGTERVLSSNYLGSKAKSCGCMKGKSISDKKKQKLDGQRFGRLTVLYEAGRNRNGVIMWICRCDCGAVKRIAGKALTGGRTVSCGCYGKEHAGKCNLIDLTGKQFGK